MKSKEKSAEDYSFELIDGVLHITYKKGLNINLSIAEQLVADRIKFIKSASYSLIPVVDYMAIKYMNKAAREFLGLNAGKGVSALAIVAKSLATKTIVRTFLMVEQPDIPIRLFDDEKKALNWIKKFVK